jgi:adenine-specific DNA-methyltransferase
LGSFISSEDAAAKGILYSRDPSLDPQLVWKGKDEQDSHKLEVPALPVYIQEKVSPEALIQNLRSEVRGNDDQPELFAQFNGLEFEKLVEFYRHSQSWTNRLILGDSLLVMTSLAEKEGLRGKVQTIYVDPPYGIKFGSNWQVSTRDRDVKDGSVEDAIRQPEQVKAFRDTWELGIHSYLAYLRDRLTVSRQLLAESGSIFVQIGDQNLHLVRCLLDEVFGSANTVSLITFVKTSAQEDLLLPSVCDYILWYAKDKQQLKYRPLWLEKTALDPGTAEYNRVELGDGSRRRMTSDEERDWMLLPAGARPYRQDNMVSQRPPGDFPVEFHGATYRPMSGYWKTGVEGMKRLIAARRIEKRGRMLSYVRFFDDFPVRPQANFWTDVRFSSRSEDKIYVVQTAARVVERCLLMSSDPGDLVIDPTCGSGTTAFVAEHWGRRWITIDTSRVALALARTRLMAARYPYFVLAESILGKGDRGYLSDPIGNRGGIEKGFVYRTVPHIMLKSIANNPEIREGLSREKIDAAIARHADSETLYDQPKIESKVVRVSGPFTVESLSPHRIVEPHNHVGTSLPTDDSQRAQFSQVVLDNLKTAGVQNTVRNQRLSFNSLEPWPGIYVNAVGEYTENGAVRRAAICIGPEHGTVGVDLVREAAKEAAKFFDILIVCGFAFEARVGEEARQLGRLTVLKATMNPDLAIGGDVLKKTGSANLFMVFGEPDIVIRNQDEDSIVVQINGLDVYDPTTGQIRSHSTEDIACWFIDTDYNEESFFVRHAYFLGAGDPYEQLKRALKAEINEEAWATLYRTLSRPFANPSTGKIAVKVINHYGDEVMKVYRVDRLPG